MSVTLAIAGRHELYKELLPWLADNIGPVTWARPAVEWTGKDWSLQRRYPYNKNFWWVTLHTPGPKATMFIIKWSQPCDSL